MPQVFKIGSYLVYFWLNEGMPLESVHVHRNIGDRKTRPEQITLKEEFFRDETDIAIDIKVKMLYGTGEDDVISQYVTFTKVYDEQRRTYGRSRKAISETIRICRDRNVLKDYLESRNLLVALIRMLFADGRVDDVKRVEVFRKKRAEPQWFCSPYSNLQYSRFRITSQEPSCRYTPS